MMSPQSFYRHSGGVSALPMGSNDEGGPLTAIVKAAQWPADGTTSAGAPNDCYFGIHRAERVSVTSIFFSGDDWRWTLYASGGAALVQSAGYSSEAACHAAVAALRAGAASATVRQL